MNKTHYEADSCSIMRFFAMVLFGKQKILLEVTEKKEYITCNKINPGEYFHE